jgi:hypothetical protein
MVIIIGQNPISHKKNCTHKSENDGNGFHLFSFLTSDVLRVRKVIVNRVGRFPGHIPDRTVIPGGLAKIADNRKGKIAFNQNERHQNKNPDPCSPCGFFVLDFGIFHFKF